MSDRERCLPGMGVFVGMLRVKVDVFPASYLQSMSPRPGYDLTSVIQMVFRHEIYHQEVY